MATYRSIQSHPGSLIWIPDSKYSLLDQLTSPRNLLNLVKWSIPMMILVSWLAIWDRLKTKEKMSIYIPNISIICVLCNQGEEILIIFCLVGVIVALWRELSLTNVMSIGRILIGIISGIQCLVIREVIIPPCSNENLKLGCTVYYLWQERNGRILYGNAENLESC